MRILVITISPYGCVEHRGVTKIEYISTSDGYAYRVTLSNGTTANYLVDRYKIVIV